MTHTSMVNVFYHYLKAPGPAITHVTIACHYDVVGCGSVWLRGCAYVLNCEARIRHAFSLSHASQSISPPPRRAQPLIRRPI